MHQALLGIFLVGLFSLLSLVCFVVAALHARAALAVQRWSTTYGRVVFSGTEKRRVSQQYTFDVRVVYRYEVHGLVYDSATLDVADMAGASRGSTQGGAQARADRYPVGSVVQVWYDPRKPERSVTNPRAPTRLIWLMLGLSALLFGVALAVGVGFWFLGGRASPAVAATAGLRSGRSGARSREGRSRPEWAGAERRGGLEACAALPAGLVVRRVGLVARGAALHRLVGELTADHGRAAIVAEVRFALSGAVEQIGPIAALRRETQHAEVPSAEQPAPEAALQGRFAPAHRLLAVRALHRRTGVCAVQGPLHQRQGELVHALSCSDATATRAPRGRP